jgi:TATA-box binding protein (TBP) (component of TFIID and TFIIIB)
MLPAEYKNGKAVCTGRQNKETEWQSVLDVLEGKAEKWNGSI